MIATHSRLVEQKSFLKGGKDTNKWSLPSVFSTNNVICSLLLCYALGLA